MWRDLVIKMESDFKLSDADLASYAGCNPSTVWAWINENRKPRRIYIRNIENNLKIKIDLGKFDYGLVSQAGKNLLPVIEQNKLREISMASVGESERYEGVSGIAHSNNSFLVSVQRDEMTPDYHEGDRLLVDLGVEAKTDYPVFVQSERGVFFGRIKFRDDLIILNYSNPKYPAEIFKREEITTIAVVIKLIRDTI